MGVNLNNTGVVSFPTTYFASLTTYTTMVWVNTTAFNAAVSRIWVAGESSTSKFAVLGLAASGDGSEIVFTSNPNGGVVGIWRTTTDPVALAVPQLLAATYDNTSTSNDPLLYYNGVSQAITETSTPNGSGAIATANFSNIGSTSVPYNGICFSNYVFNRILSATEILDIYNGRQAIPKTPGLVFAPALWQAAGNTGEGDTLDSANTIPDHISGVLGVPAGSPLFRGDTALTFEGVA